MASGFGFISKVLLDIAVCYPLDRLRHHLGDIPTRIVSLPWPGEVRQGDRALIFGAVFCFAIVYRLIVPSPGRTLFELERNVRTVQAVLLFGILVVVSYYNVPLGKNIKGIVAGYGLYIVTSLSTLAIRAYAGPGFNNAWNVIQPVSFDVSLAIWLIALWSYQPNPAPGPTVPLEEDYEMLARRTRRALASMRSHLTKAARP